MDHRDFVEINYDATPEAHYNYYGDRGAVDLHTRLTGKNPDGSEFIHDFVFEVKADPAVREATGANEILRQWSHQRKYFYKDESISKPDEADFQLIFVPSELTVRHLMANSVLYESANLNHICEELGGNSVREQIMFRTANSGHAPVHPFTQVHSIADPDDMIDFLEGNDDDCPRTVLSSLRSVAGDSADS